MDTTVFDISNTINTTMPIMYDFSNVVVTARREQSPSTNVNTGLSLNK